MIIIGSGGAGTSALKAIREVDKESEITVISEEVPYSPCSLPYLISGEVDTRLDKGFYKRFNAEFLKRRVKRIIPKKREIILEGESINFDKLLIAAGAKPIVPEWAKGENIYIMGTLDTALKIKSNLRNSALVVGGGFIGVETGVMLKKAGVEVTIVEKLPFLLSRMLDPDVSVRVAKILKEKGISILVNETIKKVKEEREQIKVTLSKKTLHCDMIIVAIGVKPNLDILKGSGIAFNQGIVVNSRMQTNKPHIYAAGDIAEVWEQIEGGSGWFAIWPNAIEQGRVAGLNMAGIPTNYQGAEVLNVINIFDTPVIGIGFSKGERVISRSTPSYYKKIIIKNNRIIGLQFVGTEVNAGIFYSLMKKRTDISGMEERILDDNFILF
jgi:NADPH-dependent 2,4-dienoyl-CoA reductase/sulfur reductase-like enzyme